MFIGQESPAIANSVKDSAAVDEVAIVTMMLLTCLKVRHNYDKYHEFLLLQNLMKVQRSLCKCNIAAWA